MRGKSGTTSETHYRAFAEVKLHIRSHKRRGPKPLQSQGFKMIIYSLAVVAFVFVLSSALVRDDRTGLALSLASLACVLTIAGVKIVSL
jgi:hypothetical protein